VGFEPEAAKADSRNTVNPTDKLTQRGRLANPPQYLRPVLPFCHSNNGLVRNWINDQTAPTTELVRQKGRIAPLGPDPASPARRSAQTLLLQQPGVGFEPEAAKADSRNTVNPTDKLTQRGRLANPPQYYPPYLHPASWPPRLYLSLRLILRLSLSLSLTSGPDQMVVRIHVICSMRLIENFLTAAETKYKAETKAEAENSEALDCSEILLSIGHGWKIAKADS